MKKIWNFIKNAVATVSVICLSKITLDNLIPATRLEDNSGDVLVGTVTVTILIVFIYSKLSKRFNL